MKSMIEVDVANKLIFYWRISRMRMRSILMGKNLILFYYISLIKLKINIKFTNSIIYVPKVLFQKFQILI